jgi:antitoxin HicB
MFHGPPHAIPKAVTGIIDPRHGSKETGAGLVAGHDEFRDTNIQVNSMLTYPVRLTPYTNGILQVAFPDVPGAHSEGKNKEHALMNALEALEAVFQSYVEDGNSLPLPSLRTTGQATLTLSPLSTAKVLLWNEMVAKQLNKDELARRLDVPPALVGELFDFSRQSTMDLIDQAARALGRRIELTLV